MTDMWILIAEQNGRRELLAQSASQLVVRTALGQTVGNLNTPTDVDVDMWIDHDGSLCEGVSLEVPADDEGMQPVRLFVRRLESTDERCEADGGFPFGDT